MSEKNLTQNQIQLNPIGFVHSDEKNNEYWLKIDRIYRPALKELQKYSHVIILWWADRHDNPQSRSVLISEELPSFYGKDAPSMGVFANRSELRPNPIGLTISAILNIDTNKGIIKLPWIDAFDKTPILDLKPYLKMSEIVKSAKYPPYIQSWPECQEDVPSWFEKLNS